MEITHKNNLKMPKKYENNLIQRNIQSGLAQSYNLNPSQKYQNALINLREGLTELGNLNDEKEMKRKSNTLYNIRVDNYIKDILVGHGSNMTVKLKFLYDIPYIL